MRDDDLHAVGTLGDPVRHELYRHASAEPGGVNREQAARALAISRTLAAYHLDRLVDAGLLQVAYRRPPGRTGPGAGRPAKVYSRSDHAIQVSMPPRNYELAARVLVDAAAADPSNVAEGALPSAARRFGNRLGRESRVAAGRNPSRQRLVASLRTELEGVGFEPAADHLTITLRNCPFDALARTHRSMVCGMNLALMEGAVEGLAIEGMHAVLDAAPGRCCVVLEAHDPDRCDSAQ